jgi:hypothetical protein
LFLWLDKEMKNKSSWTLPPESINPWQDLLDTANMLRDTPTTETLVLPACVAAKLEKRWKEGQKK